MKVGYALAVLLLFWASAGAHATKPRPIDCEKAQALRLGQTSRQTTKALGKPYSIEFSRSSMAYGWVSEDGADSVRVAFDAMHRKIDDRMAIRISGSCGGRPLAADVALDPRLSGIPRQIIADGTPFHLAYAAENVAQQVRFLEYVPKGQSLDHWRRMIAVFVHTDGSTPSSQLETMNRVAVRTKNPHFKEVLLAPDGAEAIGALPSLREEGVEYQVARWVSVPGGVLATVYLTRTYNRDGADRDTFVADQEAGIDRAVGMLKDLPAITPPELHGNGALTLTRNGTEDSVVDVSP